MGFGERRLMAARTSGEAADDPASTTTTPSSPTWTPMFAPAPAMTKRDGRTSRTSGAFDGATTACDAATFKDSEPQTAIITATRARDHALGKARGETPRPQCKMQILLWA